VRLAMKYSQIDRKGGDNCDQEDEPKMEWGSEHERRAGYVTPSLTAQPVIQKPVIAHDFS